MRRTALSRSLSAKILLLTVACVLLGEVLIYVPVDRTIPALAYLQERIAAAHLAMLNVSPRRDARSSTWTRSMHDPRPTPGCPLHHALQCVSGERP